MSQIQNQEEMWSWKIKKWSWKGHGKVMEKYFVKYVETLKHHIGNVWEYIVS